MIGDATVSLTASLREVSKRYSKGFFRKTLIWAVRNVSIEIRRKQIISIVGESGSGKTTIGKMITGLVIPSLGDVIWSDTIVISGGRVVDREFFKRNRHKYVYVHQDPYAALNPSKNVWSILKPIIDRYMSHLGENDKYNYVKRLLEEVGLVPADYFIDKYPHHLSGGMRQRLMLARALAVEPNLIVADEIVSMVDPSIRISIINLLKDFIKNRDLSIIFISHDLGVAAYAAENNPMYVMLRGVVVETGPAYEILESPRHPYTRALISNMSVPLVSREKKVRELVDIVSERSNRSINTFCPFASLCPLYDETCNSLTPKDYVRVNRDHTSLCVKADKLPEWKPRWSEYLGES